MSTDSYQRDFDHTLYQALPAICLTLDHQGWILAVNQYGAVCLGYSTEELIGKPISQFIDQTEQTRWQTLLDQSSQQLYKTNYWDGELIDKKGEKIKVQVSARASLPALTLPHQPAIISLICQESLPNYLSASNELGISAEITSQCEKYFHAIFNQTLQWIVLLKPNGTVIQANQTALNFGKFSQEQVQGRLFWECQWWTNLAGSSLSPNFEGEVDQHFQLAILRAGAGERVQFEVEIGNWPEQNIILNFLIHPIFDEAGQVSLLIAQNQDITESKRSEVALRESEERYRSVIAAMAEGIVLQDAQGVVQACNAAAERILGLSADQIMGRISVDPRWRTIHEDGSPFKSENHPLAITLRTGRPCQNVVMGICKPDQTLCWISMNSQPLFAPAQSKPYAAISSFTEITERKQAEIALRQQAERERLIGTVTQRIRRSLNLQATLDTTVAEIRHLLQTDRVIIFRFEPFGEGKVVVESVGAGWPSILGTNIYDPCFLETCVDYYRQGNIRAIENIHTVNLSPCHIQLLSQFQVQANLVVPILQQHEAGEPDYLWGLLIAHQCRSPRRWQRWEQDLLLQLTEQVAIAIQQAQLYQQLESANQELQRLAMLDGLTLVANRRRFDDYLEAQWQQLSLKQAPLSLILGDIDCFKPYNDTYGHQAGDACLKQVAEMIQKTAEQRANLVARYGGEEFAVILPHTPLNEAVALAQAIRNNIRSLQIPHRQSSVATIVTMSLGVASGPAYATTPVQLIAAADVALYEAKTKGRDQVVTSSVAG